MSFISKTWAVFKKDAQSEFRARYALNAILLFCLTCVFVVSFALKGSVDDTRVVSALLWVIVFFSAMTGLSRSFIKEEDQGTMNTLKLACEPGPLFFGKALFNFALLATVLLIVTPLFIILMNAKLEHMLYFTIAAGAATMGMSAMCTLISALVASARGQGMLYPVLAFPVLLPVFWVAVDATDRALTAAPPWGYANLPVFLICYAVASLVGGSFLFEFIFAE